MKILTADGQLTLPADYRIEIKHTSPVFSKEGTQSLPFTFPYKSNAGVIGFLARIGADNKHILKKQVKFISGIYQKEGQLVVDKASSRDIVGAIMINESDLYAQIKDKTVRDVFNNIVRDDFAAAENKVAAWYDHIFACMTGNSNDDFTAFPVAVNEDAGQYQLLNKPDHLSAVDPWPLVYKSRRVMSGDTAMNVPEGYGVTPFLFLHRVIDLLFAEFGYQVRLNPVRTDALLSKIVLMNSTADTICAGKLRYGDLVPTCTVADFINFLEAKMLIHCYIYPESKMIDLVPLKDPLTTVHDLDITSMVNGDYIVSFVEPSEVDLSSDTSFAGSAPAAETWNDFVKKHQVLTSMEEMDFRSNAWKYSVVFRKSTGSFYQVLRRPGDSSIKLERIGSNYFRRYSNTLTGKEYRSIDKLPAMVDVNLGLVGSKEAIVICPFIGESQHINTVYKDSTTKAVQDIIIAYSAGRSIEDNIIIAKYYQGTTQKYNNFGQVWADYGLTPRDFYNRFFVEWDSILRNTNTEIDALAEYSLRTLMSFRMDRLKIFNGQRFLPIEISYNIGNGVVENVSGRYKPIKLLAPVVSDPEVVLPAQLYVWVYESNAEEVFAEFDTQLWESYTWEYTGEDNPSKNTFEFIPPPTLEQFTSQELQYYQENPIKIFAKKINESTIYEFDRILSSGFRAVLP